MPPFLNGTHSASAVTTHLHTPCGFGKIARMKISLSAFALFLASSLFAEMPLPEHPRPDWMRRDWLNLNGSWRFAFDAADGGVKGRFFAADDATFPLSINVPFGWGSPASGVRNGADIGWYRRDVTVPAAWKGKRVFLVVGAADHDTDCWLGDVKVGSHSGGYTPFEMELTDLVDWGKPQKLTMRVWDVPAKDVHGDWRLYGKQGYGNVRGIWQTVYLEARGDQYIDSIRFLPDVENGSVTAEIQLDTPAKRELELEMSFKEEDRANPAVVAFAPGQMSVRQKIPLRNVKLWNLESPYLYEVTARLGGAKQEGGSIDAVSTYFGMRQVSVVKLPGTDVPYVALNGKPIYLQLTLDQSYNPSGYYTFPTDEEMKNEILISKKLALSGNRIHIKAEVPRKLYWADKLGLLIMADVPCAWGPASEAMFREHWFCFEDMVRRDFNHPSIFSWVLFNETWGLFVDGSRSSKDKARRYAPWVRRRVADAYLKAKALDPTRLVEDNSPCNGDHVATDINTWHGYRPGYDWEKTVQSWCDRTFPGSPANFIGGHVQTGQPMFNSECGNVWGYKGSTGDCDFTWDYHLMMNAFRRRLKCGGWLYTEHHDVINEWNGYVRSDRTWKETGLDELFPGMTLADFHLDAFLPLDVELCRSFAPGQNYVLPVDASLATDKYAGRKLTVESALHWVDDSGRGHDGPAAEPVTFTAAAWQNGRVADLAVALPKERSVGVVRVSLKDEDKILARNFTCFLVDAPSAAGRASAAPASFSRAEWSQGNWNAVHGLKACGAGKGFFEYSFVLTSSTAKGAVFRAEVGAKRLYAKDAKPASGSSADSDYMLGGGLAERSRNRNSYPQTSVDKWPSTLTIYANGERISSVKLPDDPADHRGILSWFSQKRDGTLDEAGSYGWLVEAEIPAAVLARAKDGKVVVRLEADGHGLAVYGARSGRYPFDPHVESLR